MLQNPQVPLISPAYLLAVAFELPVAMKIAIWLHYILALLGILLLARLVYKIKNGVLAIYAGSIFFLNSHISLQLSEGHTWILPAAYIPYLFLGFEK